MTPDQLGPGRYIYTGQLSSDGGVARTNMVIEVTESNGARWLQLSTYHAILYVVNTERFNNVRYEHGASAIIPLLNRNAGTNFATLEPLLIDSIDGLQETIIGKFNPL